MTTPPQGEAPRHFSMLRSYQLADLITLMNAACGTASILMMMSYLTSGETWRASAGLWLLPAALVADVADGAVARWRKKASLMGRELDSLADIVSFGVAPAVAGYALGLRGVWDGAILVFFVACGISRLARFNVTAAQLSDASGKVKYFEGTPIPTSLILVAVLGGCLGSGRVGPELWGGVLELPLGALHPLSLLFALSGSAMISKTLRIPKP